MRVSRILAASLTFAALQSTIAQSSSQSAQSAQSAQSTQSAIRNPQSAMAGWRVLFDGKSLDAWRGYKDEAVPAGWKIANGELVKDAPVADLMTKDEFGDFELELEWKIGEAGNSGIFYRGTQQYDHIYW